MDHPCRDQKMAGDVVADERGTRPDESSAHDVLSWLSPVGRSRDRESRRSIPGLATRARPHAEQTPFAFLSLSAQLLSEN
jgi:hypothetical protein